MNAVELLSSLENITLTQHGNHSTEGWIQIKHCPQCDSDNYHLGYCIRGRFFSCWRCGRVKASLVLDAGGATREQKKQFYAGLEEGSYEPSRPQGKLEEPKHRGPLLKAHQDYLISRRYDPKQLEYLWELEGIGVGGSLSWRIYIPIIHQGKRVSWTARAIGNREPRYLSAAAEQESIPHKNILYGAHLARHSIVIVEGPADAWRIGPGAVALFGTAYTQAQAALLSRYVSRYILFDSEDKAQCQARKLAEQLSCFPGKTTVLTCDAKDPGEMCDNDLKALKRHCGL